MERQAESVLEMCQEQDATARCSQGVVEEGLGAVGGQVGQTPRSVFPFSTLLLFLAGGLSAEPLPSKCLLSSTQDK